MHKAITVIAISEKPGVRASVLVAYFRSRPSVSTSETVFCCHRVSRTLRGFPSLILALRRASSGFISTRNVLGSFLSQIGIDFLLQLLRLRGGGERT